MFQSGRFHETKKIRLEIIRSRLYQNTRLACKRHAHTELDHCSCSRYQASVFDVPSVAFAVQETSIGFPSIRPSSCIQFPSVSISFHQFLMSSCKDGAVLDGKLSPKVFKGPITVGRLQQLDQLDTRTTWHISSYSKCFKNVSDIDLKFFISHQPRRCVLHQLERSGSLSVSFQRGVLLKFLLQKGIQDTSNLSSHSHGNTGQYGKVLLSHEDFHTGERWSLSGNHQLRRKPAFRSLLKSGFDWRTFGRFGHQCLLELSEFRSLG